MTEDIHTQWGRAAQQWAADAAAAFSAWAERIDAARQACVAIREARLRQEQSVPLAQHSRIQAVLDGKIKP